MKELLFDRDPYRSRNGIEKKFICLSCTGNLWYICGEEETASKIVLLVCIMLFNSEKREAKLSEMQLPVKIIHFSALEDI